MWETICDGISQACNWWIPKYNPTAKQLVWESFDQNWERRRPYFLIHLLKTSTSWVKDLLMFLLYYSYFVLWGEGKKSTTITNQPNNCSKQMNFHFFKHIFSLTVQQHDYRTPLWYLKSFNGVVWFLYRNRACSNVLKQQPLSSQKLSPQVAAHFKALR